MRNLGRKVMAMLCIMMLFTGTCLSITSAASEKSDGNNMEKLLTAYGNKNYSLARKYSKKISKNASESCVSKMSAAMKKAYKAKVKKYKIDGTGSYLWGYYLSDIDNDGKAELLLKIGSCEADVVLRAFKYKKGELVKLGKVEAFHTNYYAYPNHDGIVAYGGMNSEEWIRVVYVKGGKLKEKTIGSRTIKKTWFNMRGALNDHISYDTDYNAQLDLSDF